MASSEVTGSSFKSKLIFYFLTLPFMYTLRLVLSVPRVPEFLQRASGLSQQVFPHLATRTFTQIRKVAKIQSIDLAKQVTLGVKAVDVPLHTLKGGDSSLFDFIKDKPLVVDEYNRLVKDYQDVADFLTIYTTEAHASDSLWPDTTSYDIKEHESLKSRLEAAAQLEEFGIEGQLAVDGMANLYGVTLYAGLPERLVLIHKGVVAFMGQMGPIGYKIEDLKVKLEELRK